MQMLIWYAYVQIILGLDLLGFIKGILHVQREKSAAISTVQRGVK